MNPASSLSTAISRSAKPAAKASAVIAVSGGMVASFALPASAATPTTEVKAKTPANTEALAIPAASPAEAPLIAPAFGNIGFSGIAKPKPVRVVERSSRSATRTTFKSGVVPAPRSAGVIAIAASLAGIKYVWGGTTTSGFDCSGYTQYVFKRLGISLPRTAEDQRQFTTRVSTPQIGDLVFFGIPAHHMGIYAGNGKMWDSPHTGSFVGLHDIYSGSVSYGRV